MAEEELSANPLVTRFQAQRGPVRDWLTKLPIVGDAYQKKEYAQADQFIRKEAEDAFRRTKNQMQNLQAKLARKGNNDALAAIRIFEERLEIVINKIHSAGPGTAGFGSGFKPTTDQLDALIEYDQALYEKAKLVAEESDTAWTTLADNNAPGSEWENKADELVGLLDTYLDDIRQRKDVIVNLGGDSPGQ